MLFSVVVMSSPVLTTTNILQLHLNLDPPWPHVRSAYPETWEGTVLWWPICCAPSCLSHQPILPQPQWVFSGSLRTGLEKVWSGMKKERWKAEDILLDYCAHGLVFMHKSFRCHPCVDDFQICMSSWDHFSMHSLLDVSSWTLNKKWKW